MIKSRGFTRIQFFLWPMANGLRPILLLRGATLASHLKEPEMKLRTAWIWSALAAVICAGSVASITVRADTYPRQPGIKISNYTFDITLSDASNELVVAETVDVMFTAAGVRTIE